METFDGSDSGDALEAPGRGEARPRRREREPRGVRVAIALAVALAALAVFHPIANHGWINYDDDVDITRNENLQLGLSAEGIRWAFTTGHGANWLPVTWLSWLLDYELHGLDPRGAHVASLLLHCATSVLLFLALLGMTGAPIKSGFVAGVFAVHPLHVESVAWAVERKDMLSGFFWVTTLWAYVRYAQGPRSIGRYLPVPLLLALGLMSKASLVTLPFFLLLVDVWPLGRFRRDGADDGDWSIDRRRVAATLVEKLPLFLLAAASSVVTFLVQRAEGAVGSIETFPLGLRIANALVSYVTYLEKAFWPSGLAVFYPGPGRSISLLAAGAAGAALALVSGLVLWRARRQPWLAVGWFGFLGILVPMIGLVKVGAAAMADRYMYLPLVPLSMGVTWGAAQLVAGRRRGEWILAGCGMLALAALAVTAFLQVQVWRTSRTLFEHALAVTGGNSVAHLNLGQALLSEDRLDEAAWQLSEAIRIRPRASRAHGLLGETRYRQKRSTEARRHYNRALALDPTLERYHVGLGNLALDEGRPDEALRHYRAALRLKPNLAAAVGNVGLALARQGDLDAAVEKWEQVLSMDPDAAEIHGFLGHALAQRGEPDRALSHLETALALQPDLATARAQLGGLLAERGQRQEAIRHLRAASRDLPRDPEVHATLASLLAEAGRPEQAIAHYRTALRHAPGDVNAANNLAWLLATQPNPRLRNPSAAVRLAERAAKATGNRQPAVLDTLAASYAAAGRFDDAVRVAASSVELARASGDASGAEATRRRMQLYTERRAYVAGAPDGAD